jgi:chromosome segregation ATPase
MNEPRRNVHGTKWFGVRAAACAVGVMLATGGCAWKQERDQLRVEKQQVIEEKEKLADRLQSIQSESGEANATLEEVQKNLEDIRAKELKVIQTSIRLAQEGNPAGARRDRLQAEMLLIRDAIHTNLQKLAHLQKTNKANGVQIASLTALSNELRRSLEEKETTIAALETRVGDLSKTIETQATSLAQKDTAILENEARIAQRTKELHTAYVAVASKNVLKLKGVVENRG